MLFLNFLARYSDAELNEKRKRILQMKQFLQDNKVLAVLLVYF